MSSNATAIAIFEVDSGDRERVLTWQADLDAAAARSIGFVGAHFTRGFDEHDDWAAAVTFNSAANLRKWLDSPERAGLLEQGASYGARTGTTLTLLPGERPPAGVAVFLHRVAPENHVAFMQVETKLQRMSREFPGYLGGLLLAPAQPDGQWISVLRFTDDATLNAWLTSPERTAELSVLREYLVQDFEQVTRTVQPSPDSACPHGRTEAGEPVKPWSTRMPTWSPSADHGSAPGTTVPEAFGMGAPFAEVVGIDRPDH